jgi:hypothetical protein
VDVRYVDPPAGQYVTFVVHVHLLDGFRSGVIDFGDGRTDGPPIGIPQCMRPGSTPFPVEVFERDYTFKHAYRRGGSYNVTTTFVTPGFCSDRPHVTLTARGVVHVSNKPTLSNGPEAPSIFVDRQSSSRYLFYSSDKDGYLIRLDVDWGDGSPHGVITYPPSACRDPSRTWPMSSHSESLTHAARVSRVVATVTSVGCDGRSPQSAHATG